MQKEIKNFKSVKLSALVFVFVLFLFDVLTKYFFTDKSYWSGSLVFIEFHKNFGSAFSMFSSTQGYQMFIGVVSVFFLLGLLYKYKYFMKDRILSLAYVFLVSGIVSNTYDRFVFEYVRDFIGLKYLFVFNLADFYLSLAFVFFVFYEMRSAKFEKGEKKYKMR